MDNRKLDAEIAEKVMGLDIFREEYSEQNYIGYSVLGGLKNYSTDISAAFQVVDRLRNPNRVFSLATVVDYSENMKLSWIAKWEMHDPSYRFEFAFADTVAMAICEASLKAVEEKNG